MNETEQALLTKAAGLAAALQAVVAENAKLSTAGQVSKSASVDEVKETVKLLSEIGLVKEAAAKETAYAADPTAALADLRTLAKKAAEQSRLIGTMQAEIADLRQSSAASLGGVDEGDSEPIVKCASEYEQALQDSAQGLYAMAVKENLV
jgi:hypothetical protein